MPLSDDQRAMLRLLAQREQGYEDIAALMGLSVDDVRTKVREALAQLEQEGAEVPTLPEEPEPEPKVPEPLPLTPPTQLDPEAQAVTEPPQPASPPPAAPGKPKAPRDNGKMIVIAAGALGAVVIVVLAVLLISNSGGDSNDGTSAASGDTTTAEPTANGEAKEPTLAVLKPVDGGDGSGTAIFANFEEQLVLAVEANGLEPTAQGTRYAICIAASPNKILPIATTAVGAKGKIEASVKLPAELLLYLADETYSEIVITRADTARLATEIKKQSKEPAYSGDPVLRGKITGPLVGAKELLEQAEEEKAAE